jgi:hypothetical protein
MPVKPHSSVIENIRNYFKSVQSDYAYHYEQVGLKDSEKCDLEHELELGDLTYRERGKLATRLRAVLKERRIHKDYVAAAEEINAFLNDHPKLIDELDKLLGSVRKVEKKLENRSYYPRVRTDLSIGNGENRAVK